VADVPLMQLRSTWRSLFFLGDRVEMVRPAFYGARGESISYEDVIGVDVRRGNLFATMTIESRDGRIFEVSGLNKKRAEEGRKLLNRLTIVAQQRSFPTAPTEAKRADELRKLTALRDNGLLSNEQFQAQKNELLGP
jgi:Short C-terminal domain